MIHCSFFKKIYMSVFVISVFAYCFYSNGEQTFALIKPDACSKSDEIINLIKSYGFTIICQKKIHLSKYQAEQLYIKGSRGQLFEAVTNFVSSGPSVALILEKDNAIDEWRKLLGSSKPRAWGALRLQYGTSDLCNAFHGADSHEDVQREIGICIDNC